MHAPQQCPETEMSPTLTKEGGDSRHLLAIVTVLLLGVLVYVRGLFGGFLFDDYGTIVDNGMLRNIDGSASRWIAAALSSDSGILRRPLSMLSFGLDYYLFGLSPLAFKLVNLVIHLGNGLLLYALAKRLAPRLSVSIDATAARTLALVVMALWLLHPLNVGSVVYVVQRMNLLAVLFMLAGLLCYANGRERIFRGEPGLTLAIGGLLGFGLLSVLCKENGALITAYALVMEAVCYRLRARTTNEEKTLKGFYVVTVFLPVIAFLIYIATHPAWIQRGYADRDFTFIGRLLTEPRILCDYLLWIVLPLPRWMGIYHDDIVVSTGLFSPATTILAIAFLVALVVAAWRLRARAPAFTFAVAWFLVGHSMESTILPLELAFDHRNYLPMAGLILGVICLVVPWLRARATPRVAALAVGAVGLVFSSTTAVWAYTWGDPLRLALAEGEHHPESARAQYEAGRRLIFDADAKGQRAAAEHAAVPYFERSSSLDPTSMFSAAALLRIRAADEKRVPDETVDDLARRARTIKIPHINPLLSLLTGATTGTVPLSDEQMGKLVYAALDNPAYSETMRAMLLSDYGQYKFLIAHDGQAAVTLTLAAAAEDPQNPLFEINLVKLALVIGDLEKATEHLAIAQRLDKVGYYDHTIADLQQRLTSAAPATE
jgi:hypothetical protein